MERHLRRSGCFVTNSRHELPALPVGAGGGFVGKNDLWWIKQKTFTIKEDKLTGSPVAARDQA